MSVLSAFSFSTKRLRVIQGVLLSTLLWALAAPAMADDEFRLGKTILLGVGDHPAIIPPSSPCSPAGRPNPSWSRLGGN